MLLVSACPRRELRISVLFNLNNSRCSSSRPLRSCVMMLSWEAVAPFWAMSLSNSESVLSILLWCLNCEARTVWAWATSNLQTSSFWATWLSNFACFFPTGHSIGSWMDPVPSKSDMASDWAGVESGAGVVCGALLLGLLALFCLACSNFLLLLCV